ncbi:hypothetical protein BUALT_Bualt02G0192200 [Buddleja alternifolia]|uniref:F-box domain-containing protein n=1 Tax=Buddleja alternifolia TaxID=168488 RepID=A0AAV6Y7M3_9LAMI|nr:hypothetical protein BUALT_Bualt02G0192200 [Buddleja alternifolia]
MIKYRSGGGKGEDQNEFNEASYFCILNLPTDLIHKIFSRLQLKYILRSRVVCRAWYNLFSVPDFMHHYAKNTPFTTLLLSHYQQAVTATEHHTFSFVEISEEGDCTRTTIEPKLPFCRKQDSFLSIKGSCNGLLCLLLHNSRFEVIYIYNPTSGESISLPVHTFDKYERAYLVSLVYEFGFSPSTNNFKVLKINHQKTINGERVQQCEIFTVGVDHKWRQLEFSFKVGYYACRIALNWAVCWFARDLDSTNYIAAFDFGKEEVGLISHPHGLLLKYMELAFLNNRLRLLDYSIPSHYTMWTMEEYGVAESWTKIVISRSCFPSCAPLLWQCPIAILQNGNLLFRLGRGKGFMCYNPTQKECTVVEVPDDVQQFIYYIKEFAPIRLGA